MPKSNVRLISAWLASAAIATLMAADAGVDPRPAWIGFLGNRPVHEDEAYVRFRDAVARLGAPVAARVRLRHHHVRVQPDEHAMRAGVVEAMSTAPVVMVASSGWLAYAASRLASSATAVVFSSHVDPVANGIVGSLRASGRPVAGTSMEDALDAKRIELLRDASPGIGHVAVLAEAGWQGQRADRIGRATGLGGVRGLRVTVHLAENPGEIDVAVAQAIQAGADAWYIPNSYIAALAEPQIIERITRTGQPAIFATSGAVSAGAPMSYWQDGTFVPDALASLAWRIVRGEDASTIPIERPKHFVLEVRGDAAAGHWRVDPSLIRRADIVR